MYQKHVTFLVTPQIVPFTFGNEPVNSGEAISATCSISKGDQPLELSWAFNENVLLSRMKSDVTLSFSKRLSVLEIEPVNAGHAGEYTCTASNEAGATSHTVTLAVNGKRSMNAIVFVLPSVTNTKFISFFQSFYSDCIFHYLRCSVIFYLLVSFCL